MVDFSRRVHAAQTALLTVLIALSASASSYADDTISDGLKRCSRIEMPAERLSCFDQLAGRTVPAATSAISGDAKAGNEPRPTPPPVAAPTTTPSPAPSSPAPEPVAAPLPEPVPLATRTLDDIDAETSPEAAREEQELAIRAKVTRCEKDARKKYYFVFENGQVWKQSSDKRLRYKECDFEVTITKDFFGYKMHPDGEKRRIRIARVK